MSQHRPEPISAAELARCERRITAIARKMGFIGRIEYRHVYSRAGGAQYGLARHEKDDLLIVYAEAFERDADANDFSLEAMIAHERGHQLLERHKPIRRNIPAGWSEGSDEIAASILGSLVAEDASDREILLAKAVVETNKRGLEFEKAVVLVYKIRALLEQHL